MHLQAPRTAPRCRRSLGRPRRRPLRSPDGHARRVRRDRRTRRSAGTRQRADSRIRTTMVALDTRLAAARCVRIADVSYARMFRTEPSRSAARGALATRTRVLRRRHRRASDSPERRAATPDRSSSPGTTSSSRPRSPRRASPTCTARPRAERSGPEGVRLLRAHEVGRRTRRRRRSPTARPRSTCARRDHGTTMTVEQALQTPGALLFHFGTNRTSATPGEARPRRDQRATACTRSKRAAASTARHVRRHPRQRLLQLRGHDPRHVDRETAAAYPARRDRPFLRSRVADRRRSSRPTAPPSCAATGG